MRFLYLFLFLALLGVLTTSCGNKNAKRSSPPLTLTIEDIGCFFADGDTLCQLKTRLNNNTDSLLYYQSMSCSWQMQFCTDDNNVSIHEFACDSNYPISDSVKVDEAKVQDLYVRVSNIKNKGQIRFRLGFKYIKHQVNQHDVIDGNYLAGKAKIPGAIIWSDDIVINANDYPNLNP